MSMGLGHFECEVLDRDIYRGGPLKEFWESDRLTVEKTWRMRWTLLDRIWNAIENFSKYKDSRSYLKYEDMPSLVQNKYEIGETRGPTNRNFVSSIIMIGVL